MFCTDIYCYCFDYFFREKEFLVKGFQVPSSLKGLLFYFVFFLFGFIYFYNSENINPLTREPASIREKDLIVHTSKQALNRSPIADETIISKLVSDVSIRNELNSQDASEVVAKILRFKKVILQNEANEQFQIFDTGAQVTLNFESMNQASNGKPAELVITSALDDKACRGGYCDVRIPLKEIFTSEVRDNEVTVGEVRAALKNITTANWPEKWVLSEIHYAKSGVERDPSSTAHSVVRNQFTFQFQTNIAKIPPTIIEK